MLNVLQLGFLLITFGVVFLGFFINWFENYLPVFLIESFRYGKFSYKGTTFFSLNIPKRYFRHFYVFSVFWSSFALVLLFSIYCNLITGIPISMIKYFEFIGSEKGTVAASPSFLALALLTLQCYKRFYETHFVSVFSDSKMALIHYFIGLYHYFGAILAILIEAPGIMNPEEKYKFSFLDIHVRHVVAAACFLWATKNQLYSAEILANLRKNDKGEVVTKTHKVPHGGYFELVSNPHSLFEIIMYLSLWVILWENRTWAFVVAWVVSNQVETSLLSHWWYKETFQNYPKDRKAIIPFIL